MKTRIFISVVLVVSFITPLIADDISAEECMKLISGTWVNNEHQDFGKWGKQIRYEDGTADLYTEVSDIEPNRGARIIINEAWTDSEENIWFKAHTFSGEYFEGAAPANFALYKLSNSHNILEYIWSFYDYPTEIDPDHIFYRIYYRQE